MCKLILLILFISCYSTLFAQLDILKFKDTTDNKKFPADTSIMKVLSKSKVTIIFSTYSAWTFWKDYKIISYQNDNKWHYNILNHPDTMYRFFEVDAPQDSFYKLWKAIKLNKLFSISKENLYNPNCNAMIFDSHQYEFWIVVKDEYRKISYYDPEYFQENCKSDKERKQILNCTTTFKSFIKRYK